MTLTEFLLARIAEDEGWATAARGWQTGSRHQGQPLDWSIHMDRWSPDRVMAECEAKRRIVTELAPVLDPFSYAAEAACTVEEGRARDVLELLALPYANHPDYDEAWAL